MLTSNDRTHTMTTQRTISTSSARRPRPDKNMTTKLAQYQRSTDKSLGRRIAHFLDWAATNMQKVYFQYNIVCQVVNGLNAVPQLNNKQVELVRHSMTSAKRILQVVYGRGYDFQRGMGVRATADDADVVNRPLVAAVTRQYRAQQHTQNIIDLVDEKKLPAKERSYFAGVTKMNQLVQNADISKLLPPKP
jgi:hypothetical protein